MPPFPAVREKPAPGVYLAAKCRRHADVFRDWATSAACLRDKDYPALEVMADILGGGFRSRLFRRVRTELGYAYDISAGWGANYDHPGLFVVSGSTKSASTTEALEVIKEEIQKIRTTEVTDDELQGGQGHRPQQLRVQLRHAGQDAAAALSLRTTTAIRRDFIFQYQKAVAAVTKADILRVAKAVPQAGEFHDRRRRETEGFRPSADGARLRGDSKSI